jgi:glycosyltransferase involved in cell wall biosynthesis
MAPPAAPRQLCVFSSFGKGGAQRRFADIANGLGGKYGYDLFAMDGDYAACDWLDRGVDHRIVDCGSEKGATLANLSRFRAVIRCSEADLLVTNNWGAIEWCLANWPGVLPHVHIEDGFGPEEAAGQLRRRIWFRRLALSRARKVVVPSRTLLDIATRIWRIAPGRVAHIPNGIDGRRFAVEPDRRLTADLGLLAGVPIVGTAGQLRPEKNLTRLIQAFAAVCEKTPCHLLIVGEGAERPGLEETARGLGLGERVTFAGHVDGPERLLGALDVFAISSDTEQMPFTVLEAMAAGLPVAGVDAGDIKAMVSAENKAFIVEKDARRLAGAIGDLLADGERARVIGAANRRKAAETFGQERMIAAYDELFDAIA